MWSAPPVPLDRLRPIARYLALASSRSRALAWHDEIFVKGGRTGARISPVGERPELASEMVTAPDGRQWLIQASRPRGPGAEWQVVIASLTGVAKHREVLTADADAAERVSTLAEMFQQGGWPHTELR